MSARLAWGAALALALAAGLLAGQGVRGKVAPAVASLVPGQAVLARCRTLGAPAQTDEACQAAWRAARARFFGTSSR